MKVPTRHILSLSGGKDSAALAVYMRDRVSEMEYIFHDTDKELPETYEYIGRLEAILGKPIVRTSSEARGFDHWWKAYGEMIPSGHRRWCTKMLKLRPFEQYVGDDPVINYVGLRADEAREGYISHRPNIRAVYPFIEDGLVYEDIARILEESGLGMPLYTKWGRTRSGCFFCFYQQKIEWVRLKQHHPKLFEEAKVYEEANRFLENPFYWSGKESLSELEQPERMAEIERNWEERQGRRKNKKNQSLFNIINEIEEEERVGCLICQI